MPKRKKLHIVIMDDDRMLMEVGFQLLNHHASNDIDASVDEVPSLAVGTTRRGFKLVLKNGRQPDASAWEIVIGINSLDSATPILLSTTAA